MHMHAVSVDYGDDPRNTKNNISMYSSRSDIFEVLQ